MTVLETTHNGHNVEIIKGDSQGYVFFQSIVDGQNLINCSDTEQDAMDSAKGFIWDVDNN